MLPSVLARQLQRGLCDYVATTFPMVNEPFSGSLDSLMTDGRALFREPYVAVRLPFRTSEAMPTVFSGVSLKYRPYVHQSLAYERLTGEAGRSTLVATGTGSGKTECFLHPVLEYCYQHRGEPGIKALIIYPMNALATDQAIRIAREIADTPALSEAHITAGMYVGGGKGHGSIYMSRPDKENNILGVITDHDTLIENPPDILLTNYKMLDYLLVRPHDAGLWRSNNPETLKYIVVDEFHTFDGAQGTDLACLIRRLKSRLYTQAGYLCCVGTSATMGGGDDGRSILTYASEVFGEYFEDDALITEDRLSAEEFLAGSERRYFTLPSAEAARELAHLADADDEVGYIELALASFFPEASLSGLPTAEVRLQLAELLRGHAFFQDVMLAMQGRYARCSDIATSIQKKYPELASYHDRAVVIEALIALISYARTGAAGSLRPFLFVQVQLWMRELRRVLGSVGDTVNYMLASDLNDNQRDEYLPVVNCRDCGATGWAGVLDEEGNVTARHLERFYNLFFASSDKIALLYPGMESDGSAGQREALFCPRCHHLHFGTEAIATCPQDGARLIPVIVPAMRSVGSATHKQYECPFCGSSRGVAIMGLRSATSASTSISQLMASRFNDDKKVLAFSDSVQDAAHRAGFYNSRTWRFGLRGAITSYIREAGASGQSLADFSRGFIEFWKRKLSREDFVSFFIAPNMTWRHAYTDMVEKRTLGGGKEARALLLDIERRLAYEIMLEYGVTSNIGRTLEKSSCSHLEFAPEDIATIADTTEMMLVNELGISMPLATVHDMVAEWLELARRSGSFDDATYYEYSRQGFGARPYLLSNARFGWMPGLRAGRNTPRFMAVIKGGKRASYFDDITKGKYRRLIESCLDTATLVRDDMAGEISRVILRAAVSAGLVTEMPGGDDALRLYGLNKERVYVKSMDETHLDYYGRLYSNGDLVRIHAYEHTGLMRREDRERVENDFKRSRRDNRQSWDPNVLSCTPTLEMGIDIGDLSAVILGGMPPGQAQFLQRVGRAGRTDGNSLVVVVASAKPHDLYFYADPMEMLQGSAAPPHIFLRAAAVLERQFVAFCLDNWVKSGISEDAISKTVGVALNNIKSGSLDRFPHNYLGYVQRNLPALFRRFTSLFASDGATMTLDKETIDELERFANGHGLAKAPLQLRVSEVFAATRAEIDSLNKNIELVKDLIADLEKRPKDSTYEDDIKNLKYEKKALLKVRNNIKTKDILNFLSDEGLLPNYAFPEEGMTLRAVLLRRDDETRDNAVKKPNNQESVYEYQRAAASAISEFAPNNSFYAGGHRFTIDQVDVNSSSPELWRLCPNCAHTEKEALVTNRAACPHCGSTTWADAGQVREMLKARMVYSYMDAAASQIDDSSDNREVIFYSKQLLVDVDEDSDIECAYEMNNDEFPFGYEFVRKATLREINFGESGVVATEDMKVNGRAEPRDGFCICRYCGKIKTGKEIKHAKFCKTQKNKALLNDAEEKCVFLYREFTTEVLRLLIPETATIADKKKTESFTAAFMLGLKEHFGNVDHLRVAVTEEPVRDADYRKQYLTVYDSVPGGTGYLKQLMQDESSLVEIFTKSLAVLKKCSCRDDPQKDGCYRCLYAYRQSNNIGDISRHTAIKLITTLLKGQSNARKISRLDDISTNHLFDSELEAQFIGALERVGLEGKRTEVNQEIVNGKHGYILNIIDATKEGDAAVECSWEIEPQVTLDSEQGVAVKCKPDFIFWPNFDSAKTGHLPVAVFTDGFSYHRDRAADDTLKRAAIMRSGNFRVWSFSYKDVQEAFSPQEVFATATLEPSKMPSGDRYPAFTKNFGGETLMPGKRTTIELFLLYLASSEAESDFSSQAKAYSLALMDKNSFRDKEIFEAWQLRLTAISEACLLVEPSFSFGQTVYGTYRPRTSDGDMVVLAGMDVSDKDCEHATVVAVLEDRETRRSAKYEQEWNGFWHYANLMQFASNFLPLTESGIADEIYLSLPVASDDTTVASANNIASDSEWSAVMVTLGEFADSAEMEFVAKLAQDIPLPDIIASEIMEANQVVDMVELGWSAERLAFVLSECSEARENIEKIGWRVFDENCADVLALFREAR